MKTLKPDDIDVGDVVAVLEVKDLPDDSVAIFSGEPAKVVAVDFPFVVVKNPRTLQTHDLRRVVLGRADTGYFESWFGKEKAQKKSKGFVCPNCGEDLDTVTVLREQTIDSGKVPMCPKCRCVFV